MIDLGEKQAGAICDEKSTCSAAGEYVKSITLTIDRDTDIEFNEIIN